jgi:hypothetical protein
MKKVQASNGITRVIAIILCTFFVANISPLRVTASYTTKIEQQITISTQEYSTTSTTAAPTDNSLGIFYLDLDDYPDSTIYFEAVLACDTCTGGNESATAHLYTSGGSPITNASVTTDETGFTLVRSNNIYSNLSATGEYTVRLLLDATSGTAYLKTTRLIILQSATNITTTQAQIELGNTTQTSSDTYEVIQGPKIFRFDANRFDPTPQIFFEATLSSDDASGIAYAALSSSTTCASTVTGSEISVTGTSWDRDRSANIFSNLTDDVDYWVCVKTSTGDQANIATAKLIISQTDLDGILKTQTIQHYISYPQTDDDNTYTSQDFLNEFSAANFDADTTKYYFESVISTTGGTGYSRLYNRTANGNIASSELTTTASAFSRQRSGDLFAHMPSSTSNLDTQLQNSSTNTTTVSSSWLIIDLERIPDPSLSFTINGVQAGTVLNGITTSVATNYTDLPFGNLTFGIPRYAAHELYAATNATYGYAVTMRLVNYLQGLYPSNNIDPFIHPWHLPAVWTEPTGTIPNDNTGWIGANTTDTRLEGWSDAAQKFGAVSQSPQIVMLSDQADSGTTIHVTYALEVNILQPSDEYSGSVQYLITPRY